VSLTAIGFFYLGHLSVHVEVSVGATSGSLRFVWVGPSTKLDVGLAGRLGDRYCKPRLVYAR